MTEQYRWEEPLHRLPRLMLWLLTLTLLIALLWASITKVSMYAMVQGTLMPQSQPVQVNVPNAGRVVSSHVQLWQKVKKGQVLFTLNALSRDTQDAALQLSIQKSTALQAKQDIAAAKIQLANKERALASLKRLFDVGAVARNDYDAAVDSVQTAQAALQRGQAQLASAQAQLALLGRSQSITITSPIDGQVMQLSDLHAGQVLTAGESALGILPEGVALVFRGQAAEHDRPKLQTNSPVQIAWNGYPRQKYGVSLGTLQGVAPTSEVQKDGSLSYQVEVKLPQTPQGLQLGNRPLVPGMVGEAHVLSGKRTVLQLFWDWIRGIDPWI